jgi:beta-ureidopropionase / N-carbamoyl-L-amino-acid hydrolase
MCETEAAVMPGPDPAAKSIVPGSHLDSQAPGGRYDGAPGATRGIEVLAGGLLEMAY